MLKTTKACVFILTAKKWEMWHCSFLRVARRTLYSLPMSISRSHLLTLVNCRENWVLKYVLARYDAQHVLKVRDGKCATLNVCYRKFCLLVRPTHCKHCSNLVFNFDGTCEKAKSNGDILDLPHRRFSHLHHEPFNRLALNLASLNIIVCTSSII